MCKFCKQVGSNDKLLVEAKFPTLVLLVCGAGVRLGVGGQATCIKTTLYHAEMLKAKILADVKSLCAFSESGPSIGECGCSFSIF
ncbi:hypothetical protein BS78_05G088600 [Paspalum vaginatum]|nr:hypothetical protein BS78_05G088600 [Paspalum vaginatum]